MCVCCHSSNFNSCLQVKTLVVGGMKVDIETEDRIMDPLTTTGRRLDH